MDFLLLARFSHVCLGLSLFFLSVFLVLLILVQRGRGGGLAGALGGAGGQSAFGAKAGDLFTVITSVGALLWIVLAISTIKILGTAGNPGLQSPEDETTETEGSKKADTTEGNSDSGETIPEGDPKAEPAIKPEDKPAEKPEDKPAEKPEDKPAEKPDDKPAEKPDDKPAEKPDNKPAEKPANKPAAKEGADTDP